MSGSVIASTDGFAGPRLSPASVEVLSVVAYHQPVTAQQVQSLRDAPSGPQLAQLVRRQLLRVEREEGHSRRPTYVTTPRFLQLFGLASLDDLPTLQDLEKR